MSEVDFYDDEALLDRLSAGVRDQASQVVFVVGSGLTAPQIAGSPGVPGVSGVIQIIRDLFAENERNKLDHQLLSSKNQYQEAFKFLLGRRGPRAANGVIKKAVAFARKSINTSDANPSYEITAATADETCRGFDNDFNGWCLTAAVDGLGRLLSAPKSPFGKMVLTTNFDPLIGASISKYHGNCFRSFLHSDGSINQTDGPGTHIVHLHGYWYGSDTLHTPQQLGQPRPQLKASLSHLLRGHVFVVMAYGGWDDAFTQAMMQVVLEDSSFPEIVWCFYEKVPNIHPDLMKMLAPGINRGRVTLYSGIDAHTFLPRLADEWSSPNVAGNNVKTLPQTEISRFSEIVKKYEPAPTEQTEISFRVSAKLDAVIREDNPPLVEHLVGREEDYSSISSSQCKIVVITGFGGQGKSVLAAKYFTDKPTIDSYFVRIWRDCREISSKFEDQIAAVIEALSDEGVSAAELSKQKMEDLAELFAQLTKIKPVLIVFDNVDHYVDLEKMIVVGPLGRFILHFTTIESKSRLLLTCRPPIRNLDSNILTHKLEGLSLEATIKLFDLRRANASIDAIMRAHAATKGHAFWLDLLAAQVSRRYPDVQLDDLLQSISEGSIEIPDATLRSIWNSLRDREQIVLQALAEALRPTSMMELADYTRNKTNYKNVNKALSLLRDLNLVVVKSQDRTVEAYELHPLIRAFIQKTFPRTERMPYIMAILSAYVAWLKPHLLHANSNSNPETVRRCLEAAELCVNADRIVDALKHLDTAVGAVRRQEPPTDFVRIAQRLFTKRDLSEMKNYRHFELVYQTYVRLLANLGRIDEATDALSNYEKTLEGKEARYIHYADMQCYLHWVNGEYSIAIRWGTEGENLRSSGVDTSYSSAHNLALAQRDSGAIDSALKYFLGDASLSDVIVPENIDVDRSGPYYGNIGRCLHLMGQAEHAMICYKKSAYLIDREAGDEMLENQAYIRQWLGELATVRGDHAFAMVCLQAAYNKWRVISPPRARDIQTFAASNLDCGLGNEELKFAEAQFLEWVSEIRIKK